MSRKSNTEQRRGEIVLALMAVLAEHGYERATIQAIAQHAGLAPGLIHYHFKNKGEILLALVTALAELARARYACFAEGAETPAQRMRAYIDARLAKGDGADTGAVAAWVMIGAEAVRQPEVRAIYQQAIASELALVRSLLEACLDDCGKSRKGAPRLAAALIAFMEGAFQLASAARDVMPQGYAADAAMELMRRYIDAEPARKKPIRTIAMKEKPQ